MCHKIALADAVGEMRGVCCLIPLDCSKRLASHCFATWINVNIKGGVWPCEIIDRKAHPQMLSAVQKGLCLSDVIYIKGKVIRYKMKAGIRLLYAV